MQDGNCGKNLTWQLDDDGILTIRGTGDMKNFSLRRKAAWSDQCKLIKKIIVEDGVNSIGCCAFSECSNLAEVIIPESVTQIRTKAFYHCSIMSITIPSNVTCIEKRLSVIASN